MPHHELQGVTSEDYTQIGGSHPIWYRVFQTVPGSSEYYLRLIIDLSMNDTELTFGPLSADDVDHMGQVLAHRYCHYYENYDGPLYESGIAQDIYPPQSWYEEENQDATE